MGYIAFLGKKGAKKTERQSVQKKEENHEDTTERGKHEDN